MDDRLLHPEPWETGEPHLGSGYQYVRQIGSGGYGFVYLFRRVDHRKPGDRFVAAKFVYRNVFGPCDDPASATCYERAFDGLRNFRSLNPDSRYLLKIADVRQQDEDGYFCYVMELADDLVSGRKIEPRAYRPRTLKAELDRAGDRRRLPARRCVEIGVALARGLLVLHENGFSHRDVRPSNIIFVRGVPKLADIDLLAEHHESLASYIPKHYAAPESWHSRQADIFSFGKTLYEMSTGLPVQSFPCLPPDLRHWADHEVILQLNRVIIKACTRQVARTYRSAGGMLRDLERI